MTSLSAGLMIYSLLSESESVSAVSGKVYPVVSEADAPLPYICYRRAGFEARPAKDVPGADAVTVEILCYAATYAHGIRMAEAVRDALDGVQATFEDPDTGELLTARSIDLSDASEGWADDAYFQSLTFTVRINNN